MKRYKTILVAVSMFLGFAMTSSSSAPRPASTAPETTGSRHASVAADGVLVQWTNQGWTQTQWRRTFPTNDRNVYDTHLNGQAHARIDLVSESGWVHIYGFETHLRTKHPVNNPNALYTLIDGHGWLTHAQIATAMQKRSQQSPEGSPAKENGYQRRRMGFN